MRPKRSSDGSILLVAVILVVIVLPLFLLLLKNASYENNFAMKERRIKANRSLVKNLMTDFMRQFSQNPAETGNVLARVGVTPGNDPLIRLKDTFYQSGFTNVIVTPHSETNSIHILASGHQPQPGQFSESKVKRLSSVIQIGNPSVRFGDIERNLFLGSWWSGGADINGSILFPSGVTLGESVPPGSWFWRFDGTIVSNRNIDCKTAIPCVFNGTVYLGGTALGNCVFNGPLIPQAPSIIEVNTIDRDYYFTHNTLITNNEEWWVFGQNGGMGEMERYSVNTTVNPPIRGGLIDSVTIPNSGAIFVSSGVPVHLEGQVLGRVTVVSLSNSPAVFIQDDLVYEGGANSADIDHSLAILSEGMIYFLEPTGGPLVTNGNFISTPPWGYTLHYRGFRTGGSSFTVCPNRPASHINYGSLYHPDFNMPWTNYSAVFLDDPNLYRFPSPGVPAQAFVISLTVE